MEPPLRIHIHEDDWGMRVLMPLAARAEAESELAKARDAEAGAASPSGLGWTDARIIRPPSIGYAAIPLKVSDAAAALAQHFPRIRDFVATATAGFSSTTKDPYGSYETDAECYGTGAACFVKVDHKDGIVHSIWFEGSTDLAEDLARLRAALVAIDAIVPSAIVDYWMSASGAAGDRGFMDRYFEVLLGD